MEDLILPSGNLEQEEENLEVLKRISSNCKLNVVTTVGWGFECDCQTLHRRSSPSTCSQWTAGNECRGRRLMKELPRCKRSHPGLWQQDKQVEIHQDGNNDLAIDSLMTWQTGRKQASCCKSPIYPHFPQVGLHLGVKLWNRWSVRSSSSPWV